MPLPSIPIVTESERSPDVIQEAVLLSLPLYFFLLSRLPSSHSFGKGGVDGHDRLETLSPSGQYFNR